MAFWSVFWNGIKLEFVLFFVAHLFKNVNLGGNSKSFCSIILLITDI